MAQRTPAERFWAKVDKGDGTGCWTWTASTFRDRMGYGKFQAGTSRATTLVVYAHRFSWELHHGPIPADACVLHRCDNPPCVRPDHLFLGTRADNSVDMARKGRHRQGVRKLTAADAAEIRRLLAAGTLHRDIAARYGVSITMVNSIRRGRSWR